ncbi:MAG: adenylate/guanylate cyclase domain-containing protein [Nitrospinae bacterium]|nr:adenylate/guanylate cyclase domain-containing protein [Nitrospinota bacterium]
MFDTGVKLNEPLLDGKLASIEKARQWSPRVVSKMENMIRNATDEALFRINPILFAKEKGIEENESIDFFLHGAVEGLFQMNWHVLCPGCTSVLESFSSLKALDSHSHCEVCNVDSEASLDDYIMISFTVSPQVREITCHHPDSLSPLDYLTLYRFSREGVIRDGRRWIDGAIPFMKFHAYIQNGEEKKITRELTEGYLVISDFLNHTGAGIPVSGQPGGGSGSLGVKLNGSAITLSAGTLSSGETEFDFYNQSGRKGLITLLNFPTRYAEDFTISFTPYLSGKRLLTTQSFHDLFHYDVVKGTEGLGVKDISIVFTDLKGSTSLYDRIGDLNAFSLVRQHFDILGKVVAGNHGAIVKTIGDAVMGSFMNPVDAMKAALEMREEVAKMNQSGNKTDIILKIGIHKGASIVVNLNERLDYFGQTVNIASRVQELAGGDEVYITSDVYEYPGVGALLTAMKVEPGKATIKGLAEEMQVYRISGAGR